MAGLFDFLSDPAYGNGLLSGIYNPLLYGPQSQPQAISQPQYDPMGTPFAAAPQTATDPFGPPPNLAEWAKQFTPASPFNGGASPLAGFQPPAQQAPGPAQMPQQGGDNLPSPLDTAQWPAGPLGAPTMGNYGGTQLPIFGQPDSAALPPNARPAGPAQMPQQQAQPQAPQQQLPPALGGRPDGFLDRLSSGFQSIGNGGSILGAITGNQTDPQSIAQRNLAAQYHATRQTLIDNGTPVNQASSMAMLAVLNPDAAKTILPEALSNKEKYGVISDDPLSGKKYGFVNERNQTVNGQPINAQGAVGGGSMDALQKARDAGVTGEALYDHLPKMMAPTVKAMIEGRQPLPSTTAMRSPMTLALIDAAHAIDPSFDATTWATRLAGRKDFEGGGKSAEMVRAANQTLAHVGSLLTAMDNLKNTRIPSYNAVGNYVNENLGSGEQGAFRTNAHAVAEEMSKVFKGANMSDAEIRSWEKNLSENMSPEQQRAQVGKLSELLHGSLNALEEKRVSSIGPMAAAKSGPLIKQEGQAVLKRVDEWVAGNGGAAKPAASGGLPSGWSVKVR